jgi:hypothetical protein
VPLRCYCGALTNRRAQVECMTGRNAPPRSFRRCRVGGVWPFGDLTIGAHQLALVLVLCQAAEPTPTTIYDPHRARIDGKNRCTRRPT